MAASALAQVSTNKLPEIPAPANAATVAPAAPALQQSTNVAAPAKKKAAVAHKKKIVKKITEPSVALVTGPATIVSDNLNLRGQAGVKGEVVGHLKKGDTANVITQINLDKHAADEPAQWAKISLPAGIKVWVNSKFVDATNKVVSAKKLNLRAGPGENYSVLGMLEKGAPVSEVSAKGDWTQIETPTNAFAFVAAVYLKQEPAVTAPMVPPPAVETPVVVPPPTPSTVSEAPPVVAQPALAPAPMPETPATVPATVDTNAPAVVETNLPPRVVTHEGYVRSSVSPVAPTAYELYDSESGNAVNYLNSTTTNLNLTRYDGMKIIVTGEEGLSARWNDTPVLTVQRIYVLSTNPPYYQRAVSPRASQNNTRAGQRH